MKAPRIDSSFEELIACWPPGNYSESITGTLTAKQGRLRLLTSPSYIRMDQAAIAEAMASAGTEIRNEIKILQGRIPDHICTLFNLQQLDSPGVVDFRDNTSLNSQRFIVGAAVLGLHLSSLESNEIEAATFFFTGIRDWLSAPIEISHSGNRVSVTQLNTITEVFTFCSIELKAEIALQLRPQSRSSRHKGTLLRQHTCVVVRPESPQSLNWFADLSARIENFLSLLLGTSIAVKRVSLSMGDKTGWLVHNNLKRSEKFNFQSLVRAEPHSLALALSRWLGKREQERPVEQMLLNVVRKSTLFQETKFLSLAQTLEALGRLKYTESIVPKSTFRAGQTAIHAALRRVWGDSPIVGKSLALLAHANELSFGERITLMFEMLSPDFAFSLFGDKAEFTRSIVQTRNYFTHPGIRKGLSVVTGGSELFRLNELLSAFLRLVMLLDLGFPNSVLNEPIRYQATKWR